LNKIKKSWKFQSTCKSKKAPRPPAYATGIITFFKIRKNAFAFTYIKELTVLVIFCSALLFEPSQLKMYELDLEQLCWCCKLSCLFMCQLFIQICDAH